MACLASSSANDAESAEPRLLELPVLSKALGTVKWEMGTGGTAGWGARGPSGGAEFADAASE